MMLGCAAADPNDDDATEDNDIAREDALGEAPVPAGCAKHARINTYNPRGWETLTKAFAEHPSPCADYYIHLPALAANKTTPRGGKAIESIHQYGIRFHALAEFHYGEWAKVGGMSWYEKGIEFRKRMLAAGYDPKVDTWAINELPSSVRGNPDVRAHVRALVRGLYEGPTNAPNIGGLVYTVGVGTQMVNYSVYKPAIEDWSTDGEFWHQMNLHVRWWGQEVYGRPKEFCVGGSTPGEKAQHINDFTMHHPRLAAAGPPAASQARAFFDESYMPVMNGFWHSDIYGTGGTSLDNMKKHVSTQIYAARLYAKAHHYPDWRIGLAWNEQLEGATPAQREDLAVRIANAIRYAYDENSDSAAKACSPSGAYTWCTCDVDGAEFNPGWNDTFDSW